VFAYALRLGAADRRHEVVRQAIPLPDRVAFEELLELRRLVGRDDVLRELRVLVVALDRDDVDVGLSSSFNASVSFRP